MEVHWPFSCWLVVVLHTMMWSPEPQFSHVQNGTIALLLGRLWRVSETGCIKQHLACPRCPAPPSCHVLPCLLLWAAHLKPALTAGSLDSVNLGESLHGTSKSLFRLLLQPPSGLLIFYLVFHCCCYCCSVTSVVSDSVRPHRRQPTRLPRPWDSPGKNTGVGCHLPLASLN